MRVSLSSGRNRSRGSVVTSQTNVVDITRSGPNPNNKCRPGAGGGGAILGMISAVLMSRSLSSEILEYSYS
eukprot:2653225-Prymnesium_polylepis.1